ncbi:MAG: V-type ATPase subunit [Clostridia bacterium]|nr:V-type ATPase subunit [Clostridia bacterium]
MTDYLYGSAHVRALENAIIGRDRIARLVEVKDASEAYALLAEAGVTVYRDDGGKALREETLLGILKSAYQTVEELAPDDTVLKLWRYPYDCNNVKAAIKTFIRGIDPTPMLFDFGCVNAETVVRMVEADCFTGLPRAMCTAAKEAVDVYARTKNPQQIDLILDRACYADMCAAAQNAGNAYVLRLVRVKIDLLNLMIAIRILRMNSGEAGKALFADAFIHGGCLSYSFVKELFDGGEDVLWGRLQTTEYGVLSDRVAQSDRTLTAVERISDNFWMEMICETKFIPVGLEVMVSFLLAHEYEVKNLRIVLAGKEAGISAVTIRERIRDSYV